MGEWEMVYMIYGGNALSLYKLMCALPHDTILSVHFVYAAKAAALNVLPPPHVVSLFLFSCLIQNSLSLR